MTAACGKSSNLSAMYLFRCLSLVPLLFGLATESTAQVKVSPNGAATFAFAIDVPPGVNGWQPKLSLSYSSDRGVGGPYGYGWSLGGLSVISRCHASRQLDGAISAVRYATTDKICLDGERLIPTTSSGGSPVTGMASTDAAGLGGGQYREYRTERDAYARIRAYGYADGVNAATGPAYFKVWAKNGTVTEYGASPAADPDSNALIKAYYHGGGAQFAQLWAIARTTDLDGNAINFKYGQRDFDWGTTGTYSQGHEWSLSEIRYATNKLIFSYEDRVASSPQDASESYNYGVKNLSSQRLRSIVTYINSPNISPGPGADAVAVTTYKLAYDQGPVTKRSRLKSVKQCAGSPMSTVCTPPMVFSYSIGGDDRYTMKTDIGPLAGEEIYYDGTNPRTVLASDINADGKSDLLVLTGNLVPTQHGLWISKGDGTFEKSARLNLAELMVDASCLVPILVDFNKDGLIDIFRYRGAANVYPSKAPYKACENSLVHKIFLNNGDETFTGYPISGVDPQNYTAYMVRNATGAYDIEQGSSFYVLDVDGDGIPDIVTTRFPAVQGWVASGVNPNPCAATTCTRVFKGIGIRDGNFVFSEILTNLTNTSIYSFPRTNGFAPKGSDVDGDGLQDIIVNTQEGNSPTPSFAARSLGNGNFELIDGPVCDSASTKPCVGTFLDYNGSGRSSLLLAGSPASTNSIHIADLPGAFSKLRNSNLNESGTEMQGDGGVVRQVTALDANRDGRDDLLIHGTFASENKLLLSNGDGTFSSSPTSNLTSYQLHNSGYDTVNPYFADFTGAGSTEIFVRRKLHVAGSGDFVSAHALIRKVDPSPPDLLVSVVPGAGPVTTIDYVALGQATGAIVGDAWSPRYKSDRDTAYRATGDLVDTIYSGHVVGSLTVETGVGNQTRKQEFAYAGLKADANGRGLQGFREVKSQAPGADGVTPLTTVSRYAQAFPYEGALVERAVHRGAMGTEAEANLLSRQVTVYCDQTAPGAAIEAALASGQHCPSSSVIRRPYALQTTATSKDLSGTAGPMTTLRNATAAAPITDSGDPRVVFKVTTVSGSSSDTFTETTTNSYAPDDTSCSSATDCNWILGRLSGVTVSRTTPSVLPPTSAGAGAYASVTDGSQVSRGVLSFGPAQELSFGTVGNNSSVDSGPVTLTNSGTLPVLGLTLTAPAGFAVVSSTCGQSLEVAGSCSFKVRFSPTESRTYGGLIGATAASVSQAAQLKVSGVGISQSGTITDVAFGGRDVGTTTELTATISNTGANPLLITPPAAASVIGADFSFVSTNCANPLPVSGTCSATVRFAPAGNGPRTGSLTVATGAGTKTAALSGTGLRAILAFSPSTISGFGTVQVGQVATSTQIALTNSGNSAAANLFLTAPAGYGIVNSTCGATLGASAGCTFNVQFAPSAAGAFSGDVTATGATPTTGSVLAVSGSGASPSATLSAVAFGARAVGTTADLTAMLVNTGAGPLSLTIPTAASVSGADFGFVSTTCGNALAVSAGCTVTTRFTPTANGPRTGSLNVATAAGSKVAALTGTSVPATLTLTQSTCPYSGVTNGYASWAGSAAVHSPTTGLVYILASATAILAPQCSSPSDPRRCAVAFVGNTTATLTAGRTISFNRSGTVGTLYLNSAGSYSASANRTTYTSLLGSSGFSCSMLTAAGASAEVTMN